MFNHEDFISNNKSILIAPAGFGKTHTIAECIKLFRSGTQLILTHTHAGVASIRDKLKKEGVSNQRFSVETITSFAQKYVLSFYVGADIPNQDDAKNYYPFIIEKATGLLNINPIRSVITNSYSGLFVDEYQDCTINQHKLIQILSELLPTRILGDHLQGIYGFGNEKLINMCDLEEFKDFKKYELVTPWRWIIGQNEKLGNDLKSIRNSLENSENIDLNNYKLSIETYLMTDENQYLNSEIKDDTGNKNVNPINKLIWSLKKEKSLLILFPNDDKNKGSGQRERFIKFFGEDFKLIEAIDDKDFYTIAKTFDKTTPKKIEKDIDTFLKKCFTKKSLDQWFTDEVTKPDELKLINQIKSNIQKLKSEINKCLLSETLKKVAMLPRIKCFRKDLIYSVISALFDSEMGNISVYQAMINKRNAIRRMGRKTIGKCVGTTLLTKGLEFETVVLVNADSFTCPKHLYVAMTRASNRLIVLTKSAMLSPYKP